MVTDGIAVFTRDVTKVFGRGETEVHALRGIDLEIRMGELTMLVGPSGSGKTTLLSVITGLLDASSGELAVLGQRPAALSPEELILFRRKNLGFVFQQYNLIPALTAAERGEASRPLRLRDGDFQDAIRDLVQFGGELTQKLLGYQTRRLGFPTPAESGAVCT